MKLKIFIRIIWKYIGELNLGWNSGLANRVELPIKELTTTLYGKVWHSNLSNTHIKL